MKIKRLKSLKRFLVIRKDLVYINVNMKIQSKLKVIFTSCSVLFLANITLANNLAKLPEKMIVVTSIKRPVSNKAAVVSLLNRHGKIIRVYNLDDVSLLERRWSEDLPNNEDQAKAVFEKRLKVFGKKQFEAEVIKAYQGVIVAIRHQIERYPVVIFDDTWAVYGVTDLREALSYYQKVSE